MEDKLYLGIDIGTYETKGVLVDSKGFVHNKASIKHEMIIPKPGWAEHSPKDVWWGDFVKITNILLSEKNVFSEQIASVAVSAIGPCMLPIDNSGSPLYSGILYGVDTRATKEIKFLNETIGEEKIFNFGGNTLTSQSIGPKILWLKNNHPEIYKKADKIVTSTTFVVKKLTNKCVIDHYTAANFTPLYDKSKLKWSDELSKGIIDISKLPELKWSTEIAGYITEKASLDTGLPKGVPVTVGTIDAAAEAISVGVKEIGDMMIMYGSTMFFIGLTSRNKSNKTLWSAPWLFEDEYALMAGTSTSGTITQWFKKEFAKDLNSDTVFEKLTKLAEKSPIGSNNLITLPYFSGERTPIQNPNACGIIFGLNLTHTRGDIYRSIIEGISFGANHIIETFKDSGFIPNKLFAVGGGVKNKIWTTAVSDISGLDQIVKSKTLGAAYGNAFLAALSIRDVKRTDIIDWNSNLLTITSKSNKIYSKQYKLFKKLYKNTSGMLDIKN